MTVPSRSAPSRARARRLFAAAAVATTAVALAVPAAASAATGHARSIGTAAGPAVFVQTENTAGNQVVAYTRASDGTLSLAGTYPTGGLGGQLTGSVVDHLASPGLTPVRRGAAPAHRGERDIEGLSSEEVCSVLEISESNQRVLLHRGRSRLRQAIETGFGRPS